MPSPITDDVAQIAKNLARSSGYVVFPVGEDKRPTVKAWQHVASRKPAVIEELWAGHPGPLIGIVTGSPSGIDVLDFDAKPEARLFWRNWRDELLPTRAYETRSGGLHLYYKHRNGIRNTQGRICAGVDTRGDGGYAVAWFAAGFGCYDQSSLAPWPDRIATMVLHQPAPPPLHRRDNEPRSITGLIDYILKAREGERNRVFHWAACRCAERGQLSSAIEASLIVAAQQVGLTELEARRTIASARRTAP